MKKYKLDLKRKKQIVYREAFGNWRVIEKELQKSIFKIGTQCRSVRNPHVILDLD